MRDEVRAFTTYGRTSAMGRTSVLADCPFCGNTVCIFVWSFAGSGKKACACGALFRRGNGCHKLTEVSK